MTKKEYIVNKAFVNDYGTTIHVPETSKSNRIPNKFSEENYDSRKDVIRIWKNIIIVVIALFLVLVGLNASMALIASIIQDQQLAFVSLSVMSAVELVGVIAPVFLILMGGRNLFIASNCMITLFIASMFFPAYWSLVPGAILLGLGWPFQWIGAFSYLRELVVRLSKIQNLNLDVFLVRIFGAVGLSIQSSIICGNLISFFILNGEDTHVNGTANNETLAVCGKNYCNEELEKAAQIKIPDQWRLNTLFGVLTASGVIGCFLPLFADNRKSSDQEEQDEISNSQKSFMGLCKEGLRPFIQAMKTLKNPKQLLLFPYFFYLGFEMPYYLSDFTKAYVSCALGIPYIGATMACFGVANILFCLIQSHLVKWFGKIAVILFGGLVHATAIVVSFTWQPVHDSAYVYYILAAMLGIGDATVFTQGFALTSVVLGEDSNLAYSNCTFVANISFLIAYVYSFFVCITVKLYVIIVSLIVGIICVCLLEILYRPK